jgi:hypothetical protein
MRHKLLILTALTAAALTTAAAALAGTITATATVAGTAGVSLTLPSGPSFSSTLNGSDQTVSYSPLLSVVDARGGGAGWNLQISATDFADSSGHSLAAGQVASVAYACTAGSSCTAPTSTGISYPLTISETAGKFFSAALNTGLGKVSVTPTIDIVVPGNAFAGTYTSTVTLGATTGP